MNEITTDLKSLNEQTLNNFEINFVKDGSSFDSSDENFGYQNDFQVNFKYYLN